MVVMTSAVAMALRSPRLNNLCTTFSPLIPQLPEAGTGSNLRNYKENIHFMSKNNDPTLALKVRLE